MIQKMFALMVAVAVSLTSLFAANFASASEEALNSCAKPPYSDIQSISVVKTLTPNEDYDRPDVEAYAVKVVYITGKDARGNNLVVAESYPITEEQSRSGNYSIELKEWASNYSRTLSGEASGGFKFTNSDECTTSFVWMSCKAL